MSESRNKVFHPSPFLSILQQPPRAAARVLGAPDYPEIAGNVLFYETGAGVLVTAEISGLPSGAANCPSPVFAFHIHAGESCTGNETDPFADALGHYDPKRRPHPCHAGDMPPLFGNGGYAFLAFFTDRFTAEEILGRTVIIHGGPDDFTSQPAGNAGAKIACGVIVPVIRQR